MNKNWRLNALKKHKKQAEWLKDHLSLKEVLKEKKNAKKKKVR